jgi:hypothetical protein
MRNVLTFLSVWVLAVLTASASANTPRFSSFDNTGAQGSDKEYFYCVLVGESQHKRDFFTGVFSGNNSDQRTYENQFSAFVGARYGGVIGSASCRFDKSRSVALMRREDDKISSGCENRAVIETNSRP